MLWEQSSTELAITVSSVHPVQHLRSLLITCVHPFVSPALTNLPIFHIWTHDSVAVGEDGPTHQPVETVSGLRVIPNFDVIRPADPEETAGAFVAALQRTNGPTGLILTRQNVPNLNEVSVSIVEGVLKGGYIARKETEELELIILASGSEVSVAMEAATQLEQLCSLWYQCHVWRRFDRRF